HTSNSPIIDRVRSPIAVTYPLVADWFQELVSHETRGTDNIDYTAFTDKCIENQIFRLDDITLFTAAELCDHIGMKPGTARRVINWAKIDKERLENKAAKRQQLH